MIKPKVMLLTDYRNHFYESVRARGASLDIESIKKHFYKNGYDLTVKQFHEVEFRDSNYKGTVILYQSSEDRGGLYKDYIEDVLLGFMLQGAILIPDFMKFRAHHNKVFMEIFRSISGGQCGKQLYSKGYGTYEDFEREIHKQPEKLVMKPAAGAGSAGVRLMEGHAAQLRYARKLSLSFNPIDFLKILVNSVIKKDYTKKSWHRKKYVVQEFVPDLEEDYKVLVYGEKYYVLNRKTRKNDFRASGSGNFTFPVSPPAGLLDAAAEYFHGFNVPFISMDIAKSGDDYVLIEFQFLNFGNYTIERSSYCYTHSDANGWEKIEEVPELEREFVASVVRYINTLM